MDTTEIGSTSSQQSTIFQSLVGSSSSQQSTNLSKSKYWTSVDSIPQSEQNNVRVFPGKHVRKMMTNQIQFHEQIGEGGQGVVYNAKVISQQSNEGQPVVLHEKCVVKKFKGKIHENYFGQWPEELFECQTMCNNICQFYGYSNDEDAFCLLMYKYDCSLRDNIDKQMKKGTYKGRPFHGPVALSIIIQIAIGMTYLHQINIIHRDLKADNILVMYISKDDDTPAGVFIADFDVAPTVVGTSFWRAPEILQAIRDNMHLYNTRRINTSVYEASKRTLPFTAKSDVYSFAMICYEILTGGIPLEGTKYSNYDVVLSGERPKLPSNLNPKMLDLLNKCWHHDPNVRPTFKEILLELKGFVEGSEALMEVFSATSRYVKIDSSDIESSIWEFKKLVHVLVDKYNQVDFVILASELVLAIEQFKVQFGMQSFKEHPSLPFYEWFSRMVLFNTISLKMNLLMASCPQVLPEYVRIVPLITTISIDMHQSSASHGNNFDIDKNITEEELAKRIAMYKAFEKDREILRQSFMYVNQHGACHELLTNKHHIGRDHDEIQPCSICKDLPFYAPKSKICTFRLYK